MDRQRPRSQTMASLAIGRGGRVRASRFPSRVLTAWPRQASTNAALPGPDRQGTSDLGTFLIVRQRIRSPLDQCHLLCQTDLSPAKRRDGSVRLRSLGSCQPPLIPAAAGPTVGDEGDGPAHR
jgi:hypothetical protein